MKKKIKKYTPKFKKEAVKLALQAEYSKAVIANEVGINRNTLYIWIQKAMQEREDIYQKLKARILLLKDGAGARYIKKSHIVFCASQDL
jgi:transposase-like protein